MGELALSACKMSTKRMCQALSPWFPLPRSPRLLQVLSCFSTSPSICVPALCVTTHGHLQAGRCSTLCVACPRLGKLSCFAEIFRFLLESKPSPAWGSLQHFHQGTFQVWKGISFHLKTTPSFNLALPHPSARDLHVSG